MLALAAAAAPALRIVSYTKPPTPATVETFSVFRLCRGVQEVRLRHEVTVSTELLLEDGTRVDVTGRRTTEEEASDDACAKALLALLRHKNEQA